MGAGPSIAGDASVSHQSFGGRMCNSICGMFVGVILFIVAISLTGWNEGDYVTRQEVLAKARAAAHPHDCLEKLPGQAATTLLFLQGCKLNGMPAWDSGGSGFDLDNVTGVWLRTTVEMYQWHEVKHSETHKDNSGGKTTVTWYTHERRWSSTHETSPTHCDQPSASAQCARAACKGGYTYPDSATAAPRGGACNPAALPTKPAAGTRYAPQGTVLLGATAKVNTEQMKQLSSSKVAAPSNVARAPVTGSARVELPLTTLSPSNTWWPESGQTGYTQPQGGAEGARVGDARLSFVVSAATSATALAAVDKHGLMVPWTSGAKARVSGSSTQVDELMEGDVTLESFFDTLDARVQTKVWALRIVCLLLFVGSPYLVLQPIALAPERIPCIGQMIADLVGCAVCLISVVVGLSWFLLVTGLCWIWFRPLIGAPLVATALLLIAGLVWHQRKRRGQQVPAELRGLSSVEEAHAGPGQSFAAAQIGMPYAQQPQAMPYAQPQAMPYAQPQDMPYAQPMPTVHPNAHPMAVPLVAGQCQPTYMEPTYGGPTYAQSASHVVPMGVAVAGGSQEAPPPPMVGAGAEKAKGSSNNFCSGCGARNAGGAFCPQCGAPAI